jgi:hypothetical protein
MKLNKYSVFERFFLTKLSGISFVANELCQAMQLEERVILSKG